MDHRLENIIRTPSGGYKHGIIDTVITADGQTLSNVLRTAKKKCKLF